MRHPWALVTIAFLLAAALRLSGLADAPLGFDESAHAWRAAEAARSGEVRADGITNPFLTSAQAALFVLIEPNVFLARLPGALCGLALVLVPLLLRAAVGPVRTIALALLVAVNPALILVSREASGASAALLAAALATVGLVRWSHAGRVDAARARRWALVASVALGVLATTGVEAWSLAPLVGLVALAWRPWAVCAPRWRACAAAFAAGALVSGTAGLWAIHWAGGVSASLTVWLERFAGPGNAHGPFDLLRTQPLTVLLALVGVAQAMRDARGRTLAWSVAWGLVLAWLGAGSTLALVAVLTVAAAAGASRLLEPGPRHAREGRLGLAAGALALFVQLGVAARPATPAVSVASLPDLETLASDLERVAIAHGREASELPVQVVGDRPDPELGWALRRSRKVAFEGVRSNPGPGLQPALVARAGEPPVAAPPGYVGATYGSSLGKVYLWVPLEP